jgi:imidazolonepropionase-like amidohydrolase
VRYGADVIKTCASGGVLSLSDAVDTPQLTQAEMDALVDEAHRLDKKVAAHSHGAAAAKVAVRAGVDSIEHGSFLDEEAHRMMKEKGTWLVPTALAAEYAGRRPRNYPKVPEDARDARGGQGGRHRRGARRPPHGHPGHGARALRHAEREGAPQRLRPLIRGADAP